MACLGDACLTCAGVIAGIGIIGGLIGKPIDEYIMQDLVSICNEVGDELVKAL